MVNKGYLKAIPFVALAAALAGMFVARAIVSISMIVMIVYAVVLTDPRKTVAIFLKDRVLVALSLIFFAYVLSSIHSTEDNAYLMERLRLKLPFLAVPFAFTAIKKYFSTFVLQLSLLLSDTCDCHHDHSSNSLCCRV